MSDPCPVFEVVLKRRGRGWSWDVCTTEGALVMTGSRRSRSAASYEANRALFLLLSSAPYRSRLSIGGIQADREARARRSL
jgi:hypothetical protein